MQSTLTIPCSSDLAKQIKNHFYNSPNSPIEISGEFFYLKSIYENNSHTLLHQNHTLITQITSDIPKVTFTLIYTKDTYNGQ